MKAYKEMSKEELLAEKETLEAAYKEYQSRNLSLDMSRGKPSQDQLDLSMDFMDILNSHSVLKSEEGVDCRNYGILDGIKEAKELMASLVDAKADQVIIYGNSSLNVMYDTVARSMIDGVNGSTPWCRLDQQVKFLCPTPGYDRHFMVTEHFGIEMINVPMTLEGPDMDLVEKLVSSDPMIKGIWCVPKYSNPQGIVYSDETVRRMAALKPAAADFRIYWDNAYCVHYLDFEHQDKILNILDECEKAGNPNMVYEFVSTSKIVFPGSGLAALISSKENLAFVRKQMTVQTIGHDKLNQLRHVRYFKNREGVLEHMKKHAELLKPRFDIVLNTLKEGLDGLGIASWIVPNGGYFIGFDAMEGCAKKIVSMMKDAGVVMTGAGATYPYRKDPKDSNIRIAPSYPSAEDLKLAADIFVVCVKLASIERLLEA